MYYMHVPSCKKSLALHLIILAVRHRLTLTLAKLPQYLQIQAVIIEFLFHRRRICWQRYEIFLRFKYQRKIFFHLLYDIDTDDKTCAIYWISL